MATQIAEALERGGPERNVAPAPPARGLRDGPGSSEPASSMASDQAADALRPPTQKTEQPTRVVDAFYRGNHLTLTEALQAARPGERILVRPGVYQEGIVIDKPVEIIGDGDLRDVVIEAKDKNIVLFRTTMGRIANLTLRETGGSGIWYGVDIAQGRLLLEGCDITSQRGACVSIHDGADPRLLRNRIHNGERGGVYVYDNGQGTLEDNEIFGNARVGVRIRTGGNPTLRRNRIHDGEQGGVYVYDNGQGTLEDNEIFGNALAGVEITTGANPTLRRNRISKNEYQGITVHEGVSGVFEGNDLRGNKKGAWYISSDCQDKVKRERNLE
jgi:parallel beta-helix repeat protein